MKLKHFMTLSGACVALTFTVAGVAGGVGANKSVLFTAVLSTKAVTHNLFAPGDQKAPHPFYKTRCMNAKSTDYSNATGFGTFWYNPDTSTLLFAFTYTGISGSPIMMHFHLGDKGVGGPIVQTICGYPPPSMNWTLDKFIKIIKNCLT